MHKGAGLSTPWGWAQLATRREALDASEGYGSGVHAADQGARRGAGDVGHD